MRIAYLGNFKYPWCSEEHFCKTLEQLGCQITRLQEDEVSIDQIVNTANQNDLFGWTRTYGMLKGNGFEMLKRITVPTFSVHLDYYFDISRERQMSADPFWFTDYVFQPDGDNVERFKELGMNAYWSPPAVFKDGAYLLDLPKTHDIVFVGSSAGYHAEWPWRNQLINWLSTTYGSRFELYPQGEAIREEKLNELYASTKVVIGDSIMADRNATYTTDRIFETTGRGGFIVYPAIPWLVGIFDGKLITYKVGDFDGLRATIDYYLTHDDDRELSRKLCHEITKANHTYHQRFEKILEIIKNSKVLI